MKKSKVISSNNWRYHYQVEPLKVLHSGHVIITNFNWGHYSKTGEKTCPDSTVLLSSNLISRYKSIMDNKQLKHVVYKHVVAYGNNPNDNHIYDMFSKLFVDSLREALIFSDLVSLENYIVRHKSMFEMLEENFKLETRYLRLSVVKSPDQEIPISEYLDNANVSGTNNERLRRSSYINRLEQELRRLKDEDAVDRHLTTTQSSS